jgi:methionine-S-sulfoxide reductase
MSLVPRSGIVTLALLLSCTSGLAAATGSKSSSLTPTTPAPATQEVALFAGGCFWCMETQFEGMPGVTSVISGYTGGPEKNPTYHDVSYGRTGHYESIEIRYDPRKVSYAKLVDVFWHAIDPTQADGQFCDRGKQYRSAIFYRDENQRKIAEQSKRSVSASLRKPIVTAILPAGPFYRAEEYHQDFWKKDPDRYHSYREGCGRDKRLREVWGDLAAKPNVH